MNGLKLEHLTPHPLKINDKISFGPPSRSKVIYKLFDIECQSSKRKLSVSEESGGHLSAKRYRNEWKELFEDELSCSICHELFISPVNLNCSHTFCESCIEQWKKFSKKQRNNESDNSDEEEEPDINCCPICRQPIVSQNRVLTLDNVIEYILKNWTPSMLERRKRLVRERQTVTA